MQMPFAHSSEQVVPRSVQNIIPVVITVPPKNRSNAHVSGRKTIQHPANRILDALPPDDLARIAPHLTETPLEFKRVLYQRDQPIAQVCFPDRGVCSVMSVMRSGSTAVVGTVGN